MRSICICAERANHKAFSKGELSPFYQNPSFQKSGRLRGGLSRSAKSSKKNGQSQAPSVCNSIKITSGLLLKRNGKMLLPMPRLTSIFVFPSENSPASYFGNSP